jgi:hypothetical protein
VITLNLTFANVGEMHATLTAMLAGAPQAATQYSAAALPNITSGREAGAAPKGAKPGLTKSAKSETAEQPAAQQAGGTFDPKRESAAVTPTASATTTPPVEPEAPAAAETASESPSKVVTLEEVRAVLAKLSQAGKAAQVKALITEMGATNLSTVAPEKFGDLLEKAAAL